MPRKSPVVELGMEAQVAVRECRRGCKSLYERALASRDFALIAEAKYLADILAAAERSANRLTGRAETLVAAEAQIGLWEVAA